MRQVILGIVLGAFIITGQAQNSIGGTISWEDNQPMLFPGYVKVEFLNSSMGSVFGSIELPIENGLYSTTGIQHFINPLLIYDIRLSVNVDVNVRTYVSVLDIIRMKKYLLGVEPFTNALQIYAADTNNSGSVSALDIVEVHKVILGLSADWKNKEVMSFFHRTSSEPPAIGSQLVSDVVVLYPFGSDDIVVNFWAVKTGDVVR